METRLAWQLARGGTPGGQLGLMKLTRGGVTELDIVRCSRYLRDRLRGVTLRLGDELVNFRCIEAQSCHQLGNEQSPAKRQADPTFIHNKLYDYTICCARPDALVLRAAE